MVFLQQASELRSLSQLGIKHVDCIRRNRHPNPWDNLQKTGGTQLQLAFPSGAEQNRAKKMARHPTEGCGPDRPLCINTQINAESKSTQKNVNKIRLNQNLHRSIHSLRMMPLWRGMRSGGIFIGRCCCPPRPLPVPSFSFTCSNAARLYLRRHEPCVDVAPLLGLPPEPPATCAWAASSSTPGPTIAPGAPSPALPGTPRMFPGPGSTSACEPPIS